MQTLIENQTLKQNIELCKKLKLNFIELAKKSYIYYTIHLDETLNISGANSGS